MLIGVPGHTKSTPAGISNMKTITHKQVYVFVLLIYFYKGIYKQSGCPVVSLIPHSGVTAA